MTTDRKRFTLDQAKQEGKVVLRTTEVADILRVGPHMAYKLIESGRIPSIRLSTRRVVSVKMLEEYLASGNNGNHTAKEVN